MMCWYKYRDLKLYLNISISHSLLKLTPLSLFLPILCFIAYSSVRFGSAKKIGGSVRVQQKIPGSVVSDLQPYL